MSNKKRNSKKRTKFADPFLCFAFFVVLFWLISWLMIDCFITNVEDRGFFGDKFGSINALFSGLAFAGVIATLWMQKEDLKIQQKEFEEQMKIQNIQRFENTLFNMLSIQQAIVNELHYIPKDGAEAAPEIKGRSVFDFFYNDKITDFGDCGHNKILGIKDFIKEKNNVKVYVDVDELSIFDSYFRHLYRIFKYIDESTLIENVQRYNYTCIVRAQLSDNELLMLFYNALNIHEDGEYKFKNLIEKYAIFNNLRENMLARGNEDYILYGKGAYMHES